MLIFHLILFSSQITKKREICLDKNVIKQIPFQKYTKDFSFIVDGKTYYTSRFEADLLSPIIRDLHFSKENLNSFSINTNNKFPNCNFSDFLSLLTFQPKNIDINLQLYFKYLFSVLGNREESEKIQLQYDESLSINNVIERIKQKQSSFPLNDMIEEISFASSHFNEINKEELKKLDESIIEMIIQNDNLKVNDEDSLLQFITELYIENNTRKYLFENVFFSNVSQNCINNFFNIFNLNDITPEIWQSIIKRTTNSKYDQKSRKLNEWKEKSVIYKKGSDLNGIIKYLTKKVDGNIVKKNIINIYSSSNKTSSYYDNMRASSYYENSKTSSYYENSFSPLNLCDFDDLSSNSMWSPDNENFAFLIYDFKDKKVKLLNYSFHTPSDKTNYYPKSWFVDCSNDLIHWFTVDVRKDEIEMNGCNISHVFDCQNKPDDYFRFVRITSNGPSWNSKQNFYFDISAIEFFGFLIKKKFSFPN